MLFERCAGLGTLSPMESFSAYYSNGVAKDLQKSKDKEVLKMNGRIIRERLEANWSQLEQAKMLDGLIVHSRQVFTGMFYVSGRPEKITQLKTFLEEKNLGTVIMKDDMSIVAQ